MSETMKYSEALEELQHLVEEIENGEISLDDLSVKVRRASELIRICRSKLSATEEDVKTILEELDGTGGVETTAS
jgi:exodeoxyribonuclease VII small subunit